MEQDLGLCFKSARENAKLSQEYAAELLDVSVTAVSNYERNINRPSQETVVKMMKVYRNKFIGYQYLRNTEVGQLILPDVSIYKPSNGVLSFQRENRDIDDIRNDLIDIAVDDKIEPKEVPRWENAVKEIKEACASGLSLALINY